MVFDFGESASVDGLHGLVDRLACVEFFQEFADGVSAVVFEEIAYEVCGLDVEAEDVGADSGDGVHF